MFALADSQSKNGRPLDHITGLVEMVIGLSQRGDGPVPAILSRPEPNEQDLIELMMDHRPELRFQVHPLRRTQITLEHGILQVITVVLTNAIHPAQPFRVRNIVADNIGVPHEMSKSAVRRTLWRMAAGLSMPRLPAPIAAFIGS